MCQNRAESILCTGCADDLTQLYPIRAKCCPTCSAYSADGQLCLSCQQQSPPYQALWYSVSYRPPIPALLQHWKHHKHSATARVFQHLILDNPPSWLEDAQIDLILGMPISQQRRLTRGFNQSEELAQAIAHAYDGEYLPHTAVSRKHRPPQSSLNKAQRQKNIRNAFQVNADVAGKTILIIDDVITTGSSVGELALALRQAGAKQIYAWVVAKR